MLQIYWNCVSGCPGDQLQMDKIDYVLVSNSIDCFNSMLQIYRNFLYRVAHIILFNVKCPANSRTSLASSSIEQHACVCVRVTSSSSAAAALGPNGAARIKRVLLDAYVCLCAEANGVYNVEVEL